MHIYIYIYMYIYIYINRRGGLLAFEAALAAHLPPRCRGPTRNNLIQPVGGLALLRTPTGYGPKKIKIPRLRFHHGKIRLGGSTGSRSLCYCT